MKQKDNTSVWLSIFKRKGGEGLQTKIIHEANKVKYKELLSKLHNGESPLIVYLADSFNWLLITNERILINSEGLYSEILNTDLSEVTPALEEEFKDRVFDKNNFTRLKLKGKNQVHVCRVEAGLPYRGLYQMLHFVATSNLSQKNL